MTTSTHGNCRFCNGPLSRTFADLGLSPIANANPRAEAANTGEAFYPLHALVCDSCLLVQLEEFEARESIFDDDYTYFSSYSSSWVEHARRFSEEMTQRLQLGSTSRVVEIASNDGYLLQHFLPLGIPVLGIEPTSNTAEAAVARGVDTRVEFFGVASASRIAEEGGADLLIGNNVFAHVPDLNDFSAGLRIALKADGVVSLEFPQLMTQMSLMQWDTIYHEHFSYFSMGSASRVLEAHGLRVFDVANLPTHGGSLRVLACHASNSARPTQDSVAKQLSDERDFGLEDVATYDAFNEAVHRDKFAILETLIDLKHQGLRIAGYGAPAKANTMFNYCGIGREFVDFTCDLNPHKQGRLMPGSRVPILAPETIAAERPDIVWILPWNLQSEIAKQLEFIADWDGRFLCRTPDLQVFAAAR